MKTYGEGRQHEYDIEDNQKYEIWGLGRGGIQEIEG